MEIRLGKKEYVPDEKTLMLAKFLTPLVVPASYDFDSHRAKFPLHAWGNDSWGDCVKAGQANHMLRLERLETHRTLPLTDELVIDAYKKEVQREFHIIPLVPGGAGDEGLYVIANLRSWRNLGWILDFTKKPNDARTYKIAAFGELDPMDYEQVKSAVCLLHGVQLGFALPLGVRRNLEKWDVAPTDQGLEWQPGSWGGHLVYAKAYSGDEIEILSWGMKIKVTSRFIARYCDEAWACVDDWDNWRKSKEIDVSGMLNHLREVGATNIE